MDVLQCFESNLTEAFDNIFGQQKSKALPAPCTYSSWTPSYVNEN